MVRGCAVHPPARILLLHLHSPPPKPRLPGQQPGKCPCSTGQARAWPPALRAGLCLSHLETPLTMLVLDGTLDQRLHSPGMGPLFPTENALRLSGPAKVGGG